MLSVSRWSVHFSTSFTDSCNTQLIVLVTIVSTITNPMLVRFIGEKQRSEWTFEQLGAVFLSLFLSITHQPNVDVHRLKFIKDTERWIRSRSDRNDVLSFPPIFRSRHTRRTPSEQLHSRRWMSFEWWSSEAKSSHIEMQCNPMTISMFDTRRYAVWVRMME